MHEIYEDQSSEAVLVVDASNGFNSINKNAFLRNITIICPPLAKYVRNCYYANTRLLIIGGGVGGKFNQWRGQRRVILQQ